MRAVRRIGFAALVLIALCAAPIVWTETACKAPMASMPAYQPLIDAAGRRAEGDSYLTYPEWAIVHAYADLAGVMRRSSESSFDYVEATQNFWTSLCGATRTAASTGSGTLDQRVTNYIIGLSFSAEMAIKGAWERTIGALAVLARGPHKTAEDVFAQKVADDYAAFLQQTPWYKFPFGEKLRDFWALQSSPDDNPVRKWERRVALTLEWGGKSLYAKAMDALAGVSPATLTLRSVLKASPADLADMPQTKIVKQLDGGLLLVETPRYAAFTDILRMLSARHIDVVEIAGNRRILTTVLAPAAGTLDTQGAREIFSVGLQAWPGWRRIGLQTDVARLTAQIAGVERQGALFEHAYDY